MCGWYMQWAMCGSNNIFYYNMKKKCAMWLGRDERVEPEITVRIFGPTTSHWLGMISLRIGD